MVAAVKLPVFEKKNDKKNKSNRQRGLVSCLRPFRTFLKHWYEIASTTRKLLVVAIRTHKWLFRTLAVQPPLFSLSPPSSLFHKNPWFLSLDSIPCSWKAFKAPFLSFEMKARRFFLVPLPPLFPPLFSLPLFSLPSLLFPHRFRRSLADLAMKNGISTKYCRLYAVCVYVFVHCMLAIRIRIICRPCCRYSLFVVIIVVSFVGLVCLFCLFCFCLFVHLTSLC